MRQSATTEREAARRSATISPPSFVGRQRELAALSQALAGGPAVVLVEGEAGIGKTRLVKEYLASTAGQQVAVIVATCPPFRQPHTLGPIADAIRQASADRLGDLKLSALGGALRPLFPEWAAALPPAPEQAEDPTAARHRVFTALGELLTVLDIGMLVLEDVHWADEATLEFLLFLTSQARPQVSLLITCRPEDVPEGSLLWRLSRHAAGSTGLRVALVPLTVDQTASLVSSMLAGTTVTNEFAAFMHERTEGLPLAVEESIRLMGDRADLAFRHGSWARRHLPDIEVPPTVRDAVLERTARLSPSAVAILRAAAILGEPAAEPVLVSVAGLDRGQAQAGLAEALGCGLVIENRSPAGPTFMFRHALAARAVYDASPAPLRRGMHQLAGQALQGINPAPLARLAHHFREAGDSRHWSRYGEQAANTALATGDHHAAAVLLHDLVVHSGLPPGEVVRLACKIPAMVGYASAAAITQSMRWALDSEALSASQRAEAHWKLGRLLINTGDCTAAATELERAIPGLAHRPVEAAQAMAWLGWPLHGLWPAAEHRRWLDSAAAAAANPAVSVSDRRKILGARRTALLMMGDEEGWADVAELSQDAVDPREALSLAVDWMNVGEDAMYWGRYARARHALTVALELAGQYEYPRVRETVQAWLTHLDWFTGAWEGLSDRAEALLATLTDAEPAVRVELTLIAGLLEAAAGAASSAEQRLRLVLEEQTQRGTATYIQEPSAALARLWLADGRIDEALTLTEDPVKVIAAKEIWLWATDVVPTRVQALTVAGRAAEAEELVRAFAGGLQGRDVPAPRAALLTCQAILAAAGGEHQRAAAQFNEAADTWHALPRPYDAWLARERRADCLLASGQREAALASLREVCAGLAGIGASGDADRVVATLREHGMVHRGWRGGRRGYGDQLSPRELEVVRLVVAGHTNREIASLLCRSRNTVTTQVNSAMRKLGVSTRTSLAVCAIESNLAAGDHGE